jgi:hypothetical protein
MPRTQIRGIFKQGLMYEKAWDRSKKKGPVKVLI